MVALLEAFRTFRWADEHATRDLNRIIVVIDIKVRNGQIETDTVAKQHGRRCFPDVRTTLVEAVLGVHPDDGPVRIDGRRTIGTVFILVLFDYA